VALVMLTRRTFAKKIIDRWNEDNQEPRIKVAQSVAHLQDEGNREMKEEELGLRVASEMGLAEVEEGIDF